jgi:DNA-directed RNA polymerase subunit RPC12/RpoP
VINLANPVRQEKVRGFQPPWRTVYVYRCPDCGSEVRVRAAAYRGKTAEPAMGAITCPHCEPDKTNMIIHLVRSAG